nr:hypothetical protein [Tanacetum cinerariifolium]
TSRRPSPPPPFAGARKLFWRAFRPKPKTILITRSTGATITRAAMPLPFVPTPQPPPPYLLTTVAAITADVTPYNITSTTIAAITADATKNHPNIITTPIDHIPHHHHVSAPPPPPSHPATNRVCLV